MIDVVQRPGSNYLQKFCLSFEYSLIKSYMHNTLSVISKGQLISCLIPIHIKVKVKLGDLSIGRHRQYITYIIDCLCA